MRPTGVDGAELRRVAFADLAGWPGADLSRFRPAFEAGLRAVNDPSAEPLRPAQHPTPDLIALAQRVAEGPPHSNEIRASLERWFAPFAIDTPGFVTGYYEPVVEASWRQSADFTAPILPRPNDLVTFAPGQGHPGIPNGYTAALRQPDGSLAMTLDRAAIEDQALRAPETALVWLRDWVEVFLIQVQGSARIRFPDGAERRLVYAGRNGHPYTSIGRYLIETGEIAADDMSLGRLKAWLRANGQAPGERARAVMARNRSYIYFRLGDGAASEGPIGGAGIPLTSLASIAVDRNIWPYGLPFWIETDEPIPGFGSGPLRRLFVAQDTGSAILGPARADLFVGSGERAGDAAGSIRHAARFTVLLPTPS